jgi:hypothetical protein
MKIATNPMGLVQALGLLLVHARALDRCLQVLVRALLLLPVPVLVRQVHIQALLLLPVPVQGLLVDVRALVPIQVLLVPEI